MENTKLGIILNKLLERKGLRVAELARLIHVPQPTLHRISTGAISNPHQTSLKPIANFFSITVDQLKGLEPIPEIDQILKVPLISWKEAATLKLTNLTSNISIITDANASKGSFALKVKDVSMEPAFQLDTILIVDPSKKPKDRCFVIAQINEEPEPIFRQLIINANQYFLKALSPDLEQCKLTKLNDLDRIIGVIIQSKYTYI